jgi:hypothetical protein
MGGREAASDPKVVLALHNTVTVACHRKPAPLGRCGGSHSAIVAVGALLPRFDLLGAQATGRDGRFAEAIIAVRGLPDPVLPQLCASVGSYAEPIVRDRLCGRTDATQQRHGIDGIPLELTRAGGLARQAFLAPLQDAQARLADLRRQLLEGQDDVLVLGDAIKSTEAEIQPFIKRYWIGLPTRPLRFPARTRVWTPFAKIPPARVRIVKSRVPMRCFCSVQRSTAIASYRHWRALLRCRALLPHHAVPALASGPSRRSPRLPL